jgi:hypothetical protein
MAERADRRGGWRRDRGRHRANRASAGCCPCLSHKRRSPRSARCRACRDSAAARHPICRRRHRPAAAARYRRSRAPIPTPWRRSAPPSGSARTRSRCAGDWRAIARRRAADRRRSDGCCAPRRAGTSDRPRPRAARTPSRCPDRPIPRSAPDGHRRSSAGHCRRGPGARDRRRAASVGWRSEKSVFEQAASSLRDATPIASRPLRRFRSRSCGDP